MFASDGDSRPWETVQWVDLNCFCLWELFDSCTDMLTIDHNVVFLNPLFLPLFFLFVNVVLVNWRETGDLQLNLCQQSLEWRAPNCFATITDTAGPLPPNTGTFHSCSFSRFYSHCNPQMPQKSTSTYFKIHTSLGLPGTPYGLWYDIIKYTIFSLLMFIHA